MEQPVMEHKKQFIDRPVRLRWVIRMVLSLVIICFAIYLFHLWQMSTLRCKSRDAVQNEIMTKGEAIAQTIAVTSRDDIRNSSFDKLQEYFADLVRLPKGDVQYLIVMKPDGTAVVHTDAKYRGRRLGDTLAQNALKASDMVITNVNEKKLYDIAVPVMGFTSKAATVRVGISYSRAINILAP
jgi:sensor histidine kinase regulating citrate/malate metabolism